MQSYETPISVMRSTKVYQIHKKRAWISGFAITVALTLSSAELHARTLPQGAHGTIALVPVETPEVTSVEFQERPQLMVGNVAIVAIPLFTTSGEYDVQVRYRDGSEENVAIKVLDRQYPEERITVTDQEHVTPSAPTLERVREEAARMRTAYELFTPQPADLLPIVQPVEGRNSGVFGSRRFFNDQPRNPHSGIDWAAPTGTPIKNPTPGTVAVVGDFFFNGKTVLIDHGGGFVSMMCHLSEILVTEGQRLARGEVIGKVGTTGRSTGPHLHWTVSLNGVRTDPAVFMATLNALHDAQP